MSMSGASPGGWGPGGRSIPSTLAEINVTPLVDVMLVLLIVFMISAPLMQQGVQVDLPKTSGTSLSEIPDQLILQVSKERIISLANHPVEPGTLYKKLEAIVVAKPQVEVLIQADQSLNYGYIAQVMAEVKKAGIARVGLVTEPGDPRHRL